jgi:penicillin-binding protein 1C
VGLGLHSYRNYSHHFYGALRLRDALGNSLNTPAIRTVQFVSPSAFLQRLQDLNMHSLTARAQFYGDGLALGNGEITLFELVQAYSVLANQGQFNPLQVLMNPPTTDHAKTVYSPEISSLIANILSDPDARRLEFGGSDLLRFPVQTAVKTGTSNDYHDAWAMGFNHQYTVGIWLGNLDQTPMLNVSGASGPALLLRSIFAVLNQRGETQSLYLSPQLKQTAICRDTGLLANEHCASRLEWFVASTEPSIQSVLTTPPSLTTLRLRHPTPNLQLALDPRIPDALERFVFQLDDRLEVEKIEWRVDEQLIATTGQNIYQYDWALSRGKHQIQARYWLHKQAAKNTSIVVFEVH